VKTRDFAPNLSVQVRAPGTALAKSQQGRREVAIKVLRPLIWSILFYKALELGKSYAPVPLIHHCLGREQSSKHSRTRPPRLSQRHPLVSSVLQDALWSSWVLWWELAQAGQDRQQPCSLLAMQHCRQDALNPSTERGGFRGLQGRE